MSSNTATWDAPKPPSSVSLPFGFIVDNQPVDQSVGEHADLFSLDHPVSLDPVPQWHINSFMPSFLGGDALAINQTLPAEWEGMEFSWRSEEMKSALLPGSTETTMRDSL